MGKDRNNGVVDNLGEFTKATPTDFYPEFYVVDGGIVPTSLGVNSSLTISALAFRIAKHIVGSQDFLPVEGVPLSTGTISQNSQNQWQQSIFSFLIVGGKPH